MMNRQGVDVRRRQLMLGLGGGAAMTLAGCGHIPQRRVPDNELCAIGSNQFLVTDGVRKAWAAKTNYFDAHTHFFNAQDVPVKDFLTKSLGHSAKPWLQRFIGALAPAVQQLAQTLAPSASLELGMLCAKSSDDKSLPGGNAALLREILKHQEGVALQLARALRLTSVPQQLEEKTRSLSSVRRSFVQGHSRSQLDEEFILRSIRRGTLYSDSPSSVPSLLEQKRIVPLGTQLLNGDEDDLDEASGILAFVAALLQPRHYNLHWFMENYAVGSDKLPLSGCFGAMVDFNYWLDVPRAITHMRDQVLVHEQMSLLSGGFMLPVIGYNPWTDIKQDGEGLEAVEWAVTKHGCVGVKIYPPMGFFPYDNTTLKVDSKKDRPNPAEIDKRLEELYSKCSTLGVPVMAHSNNSLGRDNAHDVIGGPAGWAGVRRLMNEKRADLRINLAHFGGHDDQQDATPTTPAVSWSRDFAALMASNDKLQVYGDVGHWEALFKNQAVRDRFKELLATPLRNGKPGETAASRIMYGTDWLMLVKTRNWPTYGNGILDVLKGFNLSAADMSQILGGAALDCYGLSATKPTANRERLKQFFVEKTKAAPGWMA